MANHFSQNNLIVGVDIGGSHCEAALVDMQSKQLSKSNHASQKVNPHATAEEIINAWSNPIQKVIANHPNTISHIGIAMPGPFNYQSGVCLMKGVNKYENLFGLNIKDLLAKKLNLKPQNIRFRNDAEAYLEGEVMMGAAHGYLKAIGLTLGTGLGTAVSESGVTRDAELGINVPLLEGVAEDYISTRWFVKRYKELTGESITGVKEVTRNAVPSAQQLFNEFATNLAAFLKIFIEKESPNVVVIGGNIANNWDLFMPQVLEILKGYTPTTAFKKAQHITNAPLIGAAFLWKNENNL